jgi:hypothetical protein
MPYFLIIILPLIILAAGLFFLFDIKQGDPDYFYELGLSSVADYPIYFIWNVPQIFLLIIFLIISSTGRKFKLLYLSIVVVLLFLYEFIPFQERDINFSEFNFIDAGSLVLIAVSLSILIVSFQNIYWIAILIFTFFWINILAFGSSTEKLVNIFLASNYNSWDGLLILPKEISPYIFLIHSAILITIIAFSILFKKNK